MGNIHVMKQYLRFVLEIADHLRLAFSVKTIKNSNICGRVQMDQFTRHMPKHTMNMNAIHRFINVVVVIIKVGRTLLVKYTVVE